MFQNQPTIALLTAASTAMRPLSLLTNPNKVEYCERWEIPYVFRHHPDHVDVYWHRVDLWVETLPLCEWMFFMGADTLIMQLGVSPYTFVDDNFDLIIAKDINCINNDVFLMRNCPSSHAWLRRVRAMEGHVAHEQDAMIHCLSQEGLRVKEVQNRVFNSYSEHSHRYLHWSEDYVQNCIYQNGDFLIHLTNLLLEQRLEIMHDKLPQVAR